MVAGVIGGSSVAWFSQRRAGQVDREQTPASPALRSGCAGPRAAAGGGRSPRPGETDVRQSTNRPPNPGPHGRPPFSPIADNAQKRRTRPRPPRTGEAPAKTAIRKRPNRVQQSGSGDVHWCRSVFRRGGPSRPSLSNCVQIRPCNRVALTKARFGKPVNKAEKGDRHRGGNVSPAGRRTCATEPVPFSADPAQWYQNTADMPRRNMFTVPLCKAVARSPKS